MPCLLLVPFFKLKAKKGQKGETEKGGVKNDQ
jgi:hypothetical protein